MFTVSSSFIYNFKIGDNLHYNLEVLKWLYESIASRRGQPFNLNKPITIILVSIIEAILFDFRKRVSGPHAEIVANLSEGFRVAIGAIRKDELGLYIDCAKEHNLFGSNSSFYDELELLRNVRNRIHIQNKWHNLVGEDDEFRVFTAARKLLAEKALEKTMKTMALKYPRQVRVSDYVADFQLPWEQHYRPLSQPVQSPPQGMSYESYYGFSEEQLRLLDFPV